MPQSGGLEIIMSQSTRRSQEIHHRYSMIYLLTAALLVVVTLIVALVFVRFHEVPKPSQSSDAKETPDHSLTAEPTPSPSSGTAEPTPSLPAATDYREYTLEQLFSFNLLSTVDADHPFSPDAVGSLTEITSANRNGMALAGNVKVAPELYSALSALQEDLNRHFEDSTESGRHQLLLLTGYDTKIKGNYIQCPDRECTDISHSDHATGYSIDFRFNNGGKGFQYSAQQANYLREVCGKYGLITPDIVGDIKATDLTASAWHLRYVGAPYAEYITANDLSVEDFFEDAKGYNYNKRLTITSGSGDTAKNYQLYHVKANLNGNTRVPVPNDRSYSVLSNGKDGFIVLAEVKQ